MSPTQSSEPRSPAYAAGDAVTGLNQIAIVMAQAEIAATDAICGLKLGRYSRGQDHNQAAALLETVDLADHTLPTKLRRVLASKDTVRYSPRLMSKSDAQGLVRQARALVEAAERL